VDYVEGGLVLSLTSKYGSGKTTFLEMWKSSIDNRDDETVKPFVISLNAWESDYYGDPLFAIISALAECLETKGIPVNKLVNAAKDFGWFSTAIGGQIVNKFTGIDAVAAGQLAEEKKGAREETTRLIPDTFSLYQDRKAAMETLKKEIASFVSASEAKVFFLVDELDRCRPDYAISYLETIKHIFDIKGAVFLLAADRQQLENSAKTTFGQNLNFEEYYRKFIHREIMLPKINESGYKQLSSNYVTYYLERESERHCFMKLENNQIGQISDLIGALKLTPRQIQEVFRILGHILSTTEEKKGRLFWCLGAGSIVMAALKVGDPEVFHLIGNQRYECEEAAKYLRELMNTDNIEWLFLLILTGGGLIQKDGEKTEELIRRAGFVNDNGDVTIRSDLGQFRQGWGLSGSGLISTIHKNIENIIQWK